MLTNGYVRVGWASPKFQAGEVLGSDHWSYAFDGYLVCQLLVIVCGGNHSMWYRLENGMKNLKLLDGHGLWVTLWAASLT